MGDDRGHAHDRPAASEAAASRAPRGRLARWLNPAGYSRRRLVLNGLLSAALALLITDRLAHALYWPAPGARDVFVVSSERCPWSTAARRQLDARGVPYRVIDTRRDGLASALAGWAFQSVSVPIVVIGEEVMRGYSAERIDAALAKLDLTGDATDGARASAARSEP